jgi:hypothetical protein
LPQIKQITLINLVETSVLCEESVAKKQTNLPQNKQINLFKTSVLSVAKKNLDSLATDGAD